MSDSPSPSVTFTFLDYLALGFILEGTIVFLHQGEKGWTLWLPGFVLGLTCLAFRNRSPQIADWIKSGFRTKRIVEGFYAIESNAFRGWYLRMDGRGIAEIQDAGAGIVNCQKGQGLWEKFRIVHVPRLGSDFVAIESIQFRNCWLRADGSQIPVSDNAAKGVVNCQWGPSPREFEVFKIVRLEKGLVALQSWYFFEVHLGMDATGLIGHQEVGGGSVYCRRHRGPNEEFRLHRLPKE